MKRRRDARASAWAAHRVLTRLKFAPRLWECDEGVLVELRSEEKPPFVVVAGEREEHVEETGLRAAVARARDARAREAGR